MFLCEVRAFKGAPRMFTREVKSTKDQKKKGA